MPSDKEKNPFKTFKVPSLFVSTATTVSVSASCNANFEAIATELSKTLSEVANAASDTEEPKTDK
jgi:hypothetical protein